MPSTARIIEPAQKRYAGQVTRPERWSSYVPRSGDIIVCTPSKSGTTWTQAILAMLVHGGADLPMKMPSLSPWVDADVGVPASEVSANLAAQTGRRVIKTHTPLDGFPDWEGVHVVTVYRHPLDVFFSLRKHYKNMTIAREDDPMLWPVPESIRNFLTSGLDRENYSSKTLASVVAHYRATLTTKRAQKPAMLHYADMLANNRGAIKRLAQSVQIDADAALIDAVEKASSFMSMKAQAADFAPAGGTGLFRSDTKFFDSAQSQKWVGQIDDALFELYETRLAELLPNADERNWLEHGGQV